MSPLRPLVAIVDDEEDIVLFLRMALADEGYDVVSSSTCRGALSLLEQHQPEIICLDLLMPGQTGASLYHEIKHNEALCECPIIIMSGLGVKTELEALLKGDDDVEAPAAFIEKPIEIKAMVKTIDRLIKLHRKETS